MNRLFVLASIAVATALAWAWIVPMSRDMYGSMSGPSAWMMTAHWDARHVALLVAMWVVMMAGMMLPSATPLILLFAGAVRRNDPARATAHITAFAAGYLIVWSAFAIAAALLQRALTNALLLTPMMEPATHRAASAVFALAGLYQITPFKRACLTACQLPASFVTRHWSAGTTGAFRMGLIHGAFCLGCCWALMLLLFAGGVMHLPTILLLTILVLTEKWLPPGRATRWFTWLTGSGLLALAVWTVRRG